jgi:hypothetical protein
MTPDRNTRLNSRNVPGDDIVEEYLSGVEADFGGQFKCLQTLVELINRSGEAQSGLAEEAPLLSKILTSLSPRELNLLEATDLACGEYDLIQTEL